MKTVVNTYQLIVLRVLCTAAAIWMEYQCDSNNQVKQYRDVIVLRKEGVNFTWYLFMNQRVLVAALLSQ
jgi:hypothetical protein